MAEDKCPDIGCHDQVQKSYVMAKNHEETLYDKGGVKDQLETIRLNLGDKMSKGEADEKYMVKPHWAVKALSIMLSIAIPVTFSVTSFLLVVRDKTQATPYIYATKDEVGGVKESAEQEREEIKTEVRRNTNALQLAQKEMKTLGDNVCDIKDTLNETRTEFKTALKDQKDDMKDQTKEIKEYMNLLHKESNDERDR